MPNPSADNTDIQSKVYYVLIKQFLIQKCTKVMYMYNIHIRSE